MATYEFGQVILDPAALDALLHSPSGPVVTDLLRRGRAVESMAKELCPVDTGRLRASIGPPLVTIIDSQPAVLVGTTVEYAIYQEFGTRYMEGRFFLTRALAAAA